MILQEKGDLLQSRANVIAHQVNCRGVMGAGVAKQIKEKLLTIEQYKYYQNICRKYNADLLLGHNHHMTLNDGRCLCNMFAEDIPTGSGLDTNYQALQRCFQKLEYFCRKEKIVAAIPGYIGCGLAGGDWDYVVRNIILPNFQNSPVTLKIVYWEDSVEKMWKEFQANCQGNILEEDWCFFTKGTKKEVIEEWFTRSFGDKMEGRKRE